MKQIMVSIGNSDNKLTQVEWSEFVQRVDKIIEAHHAQKHFFGGANTWAAWQNVAWLFECADYMIPSLKTALSDIRSIYRQESVAYLEGETEFI